MDLDRFSLAAVFLLMGLYACAAYPQAPESRVATFDRYDPTLLTYSVAGVEGESIDPRTLHVSWEVNDLTIPGNGDLDIVISRSFGRLAHTPSEMGHWYLGMPRIQIPTSPWRVPIDPASPANPTFPAAWNNLYARIDYGRSNICAQAGNFVDQYVTFSITNQLKGGIFYAAPITLYIPGEGQKLLLDKLSTASHFPADAEYVTTDNWYARCLAPDAEHIWGGFEVVSPLGVRYRFDLIKHLVPGDYALGSSGGWVEMAVSSIVDVHGNRLNYRYEVGADGTGLLQRIVASDGRKVEFEYHPDSMSGVDVQGSPLSLITAVEYEFNGATQRIEYSYCDFAALYILKSGCGEIDLRPDGGLPVLKKVELSNGMTTKYAYNGSMYAANVFLDWGGFEFLLSKVTLPTGGVVAYQYDPGYSAVFQDTNSPAPRLSKRETSGPFVGPGSWNYNYALENHLETTTVRSSGRLDTYEFFEGVGTYEYEVARRQGSYSWPDAAPYDYEDLMGRLRTHTVSAIGTGKVLRKTEVDYGLPEAIGKSWYAANWLGWPTIVISQVRPALVTQTRVTDMQAGSSGLIYATGTSLNNFNAYGQPLLVYETGHDGSTDGSWQYRETAYEYRNKVLEWVIGRVSEVHRAGRSIELNYYANGLVQQRDAHGIVTEYDYHSNGELYKQRWVRNGIAHENSFLNYVRGRPQIERWVIDPASGEYAEYRRGVNALGGTDWERNPDNQLMQYTHDDAGQLASITPPLSTAINFAYDFDGDVLSAVVKSQGSRSTTHKPDGFGRARVTIEAGQTAAGQKKYARLTRFDAQGRIAFASMPFDWQAPAYGSVAEGIEYEYDKLGRVLREISTVDGSFRSWCYMQSCNSGDYANYFDASLENGYVITDERGYQAAFEYRSFGDPDQKELTRIVQQVSKSSQPSGARFASTEIERDLWGNVTAVHQGEGANGIARLYTYDERMQLTAEEHPETGISLHAYDEVGNRVSTTSSAGEVVRRNFDGMNRQTGVIYPDETPAVSSQLSAGGQLLSADNGVSRWDYGFDAEGRLLTERLTLATGDIALSYDYNALGEMSALIYPDGRRFALQPDGFGRPQRFGSVATDIRYASDGTLQRLTYGNGLQLLATQNDRQLPQTRSVTGANGSGRLDLAYFYDAGNNLVGVNDELDARYDLWLGYDGLSRLIQADGYWGNGSIQYDVIGNLAAKTIGEHELGYSYDARNRLAEVNMPPDGSLAYGYDPNGNVLTDGQRMFQFNSASQLTEYQGQGGAQYEYDANGRRTRITKDGQVQADMYAHNGLLVYSDKCEIDNVSVQYYHVGRELIAAEEVPCEDSCHG